MMSLGMRMRRPLASSVATGLDLVGLEQRGADRMAGRGQEGEAMPPRPQGRRPRGEQRSSDAELVGHLRTAEDGDERPGRVVQEVVEDLHLAGPAPVPPPLGRRAGGPTTEAWARWAAPKASST